MPRALRPKYWVIATDTIARARVVFISVAAERNMGARV